MVDLGQVSIGTPLTNLPKSRENLASSKIRACTPITLQTWGWGCMLIKQTTKVYVPTVSLSATVNFESVWRYMVWVVSGNWICHS